MTAQAFPHLSKAPIYEATIELRVVGVSRDSDDAVEAFRVEVANDFPHHRPIRFIAPQFKLNLAQADGEFETTHVERGMIGVRMESPDRNYIVHAKKDGLMVSRMAPYTSWDELMAHVRTLWPIYCRHLAPKEVRRIGARYINHLPLPQVEVCDLDQIFTKGPQIPSALPQDLTEYAIRFVLQMPEHKAGVAMTQGIGLPPPSGAPGHSASLDIDAFTMGEPLAADSSELWDRLEHLHTVKNKSFFASLQERYWRQFE